jgi:RNA polymerase sigma-70 factor, ECF subfamily
MNPEAAGGVLPYKWEGSQAPPMNEHADALPAALNPAMEDLEREFERLLTESSTLAFRVAYSVLRQRQDAEDVAQEAFIKAHRHFSRLRNRDSFRAWLVRTTWRLALDRRRADSRRVRRESEHARLSEERPRHELMPDDVWRIIDGLPEKLRLTLTLAAIEGHDLRTVAQLLGTPEGTVKSRLFKARKVIKESLR